MIIGILLIVKSNVKRFILKIVNIAPWSSWSTRQSVTLKIAGSIPVEAAINSSSSMGERHTYNMQMMVQIHSGRVRDNLLANQS